MDQLPHLFELRVAEIGDDAVEGVVDGGFALGFFHPRFERLPQALAFRLNGEIDQRGGAAKSRGDRAGLEIVRAGGAAKRHVQMRVHVDSARHHEQAGRVDHLAGVFDGQRVARWR